MLHSFALSRPLGRSTSVLPKDSRKTKRALNQLGYYDVPAWSMTDFVDKPMLAGVTRFQADNGLRRDGAMKPGGPTERLIDTALWEQTRGSGNLPKDSIFGLGGSVGKSGANKKPDVQGTKRALAWAGFYPKDAARQPSGEADTNYQLGLQSFLRTYNFDPRQPLTPGSAPERTLERVSLIRIH